MKYLVIIMTLLITISCSTNTTVNSTWVSKDIHSKNLSGVLVVAMAENDDLRVQFEDMYVNELKKLDVNAYASHNLGLKRINPDNMVAVAEEKGLETVLITNYIGTNEYDVYHGDTYYYGGAMTIVTDGYSNDYYGYSYQVDGPASYYTTMKYVNLVSSLYEVSTREMLWNTHSSAMLVKGPASLFGPFIKSFVGQAKKDNLIK